MTSIKFPYNTPGSYMACTLSSLFTSISTRKQGALCIVQQMDIYLGTILIRVSQIGPLAIGAYQITLDDIILPNLVSPL